MASRKSFLRAAAVLKPNIGCASQTLEPHLKGARIVPLLQVSKKSKCSYQCSRYSSSNAGGSGGGKPKKIDDEMSILVDTYAKFSPSPLSVQNFIDFGKSPFCKLSCCVYFSK